MSREGSHRACWPESPASWMSTRARLPKSGQAAKKYLDAEGSAAFDKAVADSGWPPCRLERATLPIKEREVAKGLLMIPAGRQCSFWSSDGALGNRPVPPPALPISPDNAPEKFGAKRQSTVSGLHSPMGRTRLGETLRGQHSRE